MRAAGHSLEPAAEQKLKEGIVAMQPLIESFNDITVVTLPGDRLDSNNTAELKRDLASLLETPSRVRTRALRADA